MGVFDQLRIKRKGVQGVGSLGVWTFGIASIAWGIAPATPEK
jgi:hypothetical protein